MKKNKKLLIVVSVIEILALVLFIATFNIAFSKSTQGFVNTWMSKWISTQDVVTYSNWDKFCILVNNYTPYLFLIALIVRFILVDRKRKLIICLMAAVLFFFLKVNPYLRLFLLIITLIIYIYTHIYSFTNNKVSNKK